MTVLLFLLGIGLLVLGADLLVRGAARLATAVGISPLVVGLTVVAAGTGSPELAVSLRAALAGNADLAYGNVVGSNVANVLLILGISAAVAPLAVSPALLRRDLPWMAGASVLTLLLALDGRIGRVDGAVLLSLGVAYTLISVRAGRREARPVPVDPTGQAARRPSWPRDAASVAAGLALLVLGARWLVDAAVAFARALGVSDLVVGLTVVAVGTSLPEVATSVLASVRGEREIAVGNVVGSNVFNLLVVLALTALVAPAGIEVAAGALRVDTPVMIGAALVCFPVFLTRHLVARPEGFLLVGLYGLYTGHLVLAAQASPYHGRFAAFTVFVVLPAVTALLGLALLRARRQRAPGAGNPPRVADA